MGNYNSEKEASIGFFLGINPKLTLQKAIKKQIDEICPWLDLDDEDTKKLIKETTLNDKTSQVLLRPTFDTHNKEFETGTENETISSNLWNPHLSRQRSNPKKNFMQSFPPR